MIIANKRILYYDAIKTLAIFFVCFYHFNAINVDIINNHNSTTYINYFFYSIGSIAVPLFFMINGALLLNKEYNLKKHLWKTFRIYLLVVVWSFITLSVLIPICGDTYSFVDFFRSGWYLKKTRNDHLWFLMTLISIHLLFPFIKEIYDNAKHQILYLFCSIIFIFSFGNLFVNSIANVAEYILGINYLKGDDIYLFPLINPFGNPFGNYFYSILYFILGGILSKKVSQNRVKISSTLLIAIFLVSLSMLFLYGTIMFSSNKSFYDTVWNGYFSIMTLTMSLSTFLLLSKIDYNNKKINSFLKIIGANTLGIFLVHRFFGYATFPFFCKLPHSDNIFVNIIYGLIILLLSLLLSIIIKKIPIVKRVLKI